MYKKNGGEFMKKRFITISLVIVLLISLCASVYAVESRTQQVFPSLSFSGTTANCSVSVYGDSKIEVTLELKNGTKLVDSWSDSGTNYVMLSGSHKVVSGQTYTLIASGTINGRTFNTSTTGTCP